MKEKFIQKANLVHNFKYNYNKVEYIKSILNIEIICQEHGSFWQRPDVHLRGFGCPECSNKKKMSTEIFVNKSNQIHNNLYSYKNTIYKNNHTKVIITCKSPALSNMLIIPHPSSWLHSQGNLQNHLPFLR